MEYLSVKDVAELKGCSDRSIRNAVKGGDIAAEVSTSQKNGGKQYRIPLDALDPAIQRRWYQKHKQEIPPELRRAKAAKSPPAPGKTMEQLSADERAEAAMWIRILEDWQAYRAGYCGSCAEADAEYIAKARQEHPGIRISYDILQRKLRAHKAGSLEGLVDKRGKWKEGTSQIDDTDFQVFLSFFLDLRRWPFQKCYEYTEAYVGHKLPHISSFRRHIENDVPEPIKILGRRGQKAYDDICAAYTERTYDDLASNDWWIADNHTFDIFTQGDTGRPHRLYLTAFFDARSGIFTGCFVTDNPSSQATIAALKNGVMKYGIPNNILVDNGREFLTFDVGGLGHRQKKSTKDEFTPPPIFARMGINMVNALPRNAKSKVIERRFLDVKNGLSRLFPTFTGGNVLEKPENLKHVLALGNITTDAELRKAVYTILEGYFNYQTYGGAVVRDRGKSRMQIFNENLVETRVVTEEHLHLLLMRSSRVQKVGRKGVYIPIEGMKIHYWTPEFKSAWFGKEVYYRYDPDDLSYVRVYDLKDRFIAELPTDNKTVLRYGASMEDIAAAQREINASRKLDKNKLAALINPDIKPETALNLVLAQAMANLENPPCPPANPKILHIQRPEESPLLPAAVGMDMDLDSMIETALMMRGGKQDE